VTLRSIDYNIGPGVAQAIDDHDDDPRSDEIYFVTTEGHKVSRTMARDAEYVYYEEDNATRRLPFR
jgi:hypothetical protein